jgi:hypothetical protein
MKDKQKENFHHNYTKLKEARALIEELVKKGWDIEEPRPMYFELHNHKTDVRAVANVGFSLLTIPRACKVQRQYFIRFYSSS